ncbi:hypothetical protein M3P05_01170 [Sansalvadorimonas sp. 2012CJ34-2]|uniref:Uncharacterized protein n=1 Tax=Parendozoicomonas callyspongiae TaxID=2942213 RepID=A0ABT0PB00_9GAMM|nr:inositol phosphate phosphatase SopB [Sansalvadorimonas sp. 2012CJ34-2]MCL6268563.1 hypothetical protein [Sansalvadorimonas sp. 2012CJ34-2]
MKILIPVKKVFGSLRDFASDYIIKPIKTLWGRLVSSSSGQRNIPKPDNQTHMRVRRTLRRRRTTHKTPTETITQTPQTSPRRHTKPSPPPFERPQTQQQDLIDLSDPPQSSHQRGKSEDVLFMPVQGGLAASSSPLPENEDVRDHITFEENFSSEDKDNSLFVPTSSKGLTASVPPAFASDVTEGIPDFNKTPSIEPYSDAAPTGFPRKRLSSTSSESSSLSIFENRKSSTGSQDYDPEDNEFSSDEGDSDVFSPPLSPTLSPLQLDNEPRFRNDSLSTPRSTLSSLSEREGFSEDYSDDYRATTDDNAESDLEAYPQASLRDYQEPPKSIRKFSYDSIDEADDFPAKQEHKKRNKPQHFMRSHSVPISSDDEDRENTSGNNDLLQSLSGIKRPVKKRVHQELRRELDEIKEQVDDVTKEEMQREIDQIVMQSLGPAMRRTLAEQGLISADKSIVVDSVSDSGISSDENIHTDSHESIKVQFVIVNEEGGDSGIDSGTEVSSNSDQEIDDSSDNEVKIFVKSSGNKEALIAKYSSSVDKILKENNVPKTEWESVKHKVLHELSSGNVSKADLKQIVTQQVQNYKSSAEMMMQNTVTLMAGRRPTGPIKPEDILDLQNRQPHEQAPVTSGDIAALETLAQITPPAIACCEYNPHTSGDDINITQQIAETETILSEVKSKLKAFTDLGSGTSAYWGGPGNSDDHYNIKTSVFEDLQQMETKLTNKLQALELSRKGDFRQLKNIAPSVDLFDKVALELLEEKISQTSEDLESLNQSLKKQRFLSFSWSKKKAKIAIKETLLKELNKAHQKVQSARDKCKLTPNDDGIVIDAVKQLKKYEKAIAEAMESVDLKEEYELSKTEMLNDTYTESLEEDIPLQVDGAFHKIHTTAKPAHEARFTLEGEDGEIEPHKTPYGGTIRNSATKYDPDHARNFYIQKTVDEAGNVIERVFRLGIPTRFWDDPIKREDIETVWKEVFVAQICETHADIPGFKDAVDKGPEHAVPLPMSYTCLLSPDMFRKITGLHENEHMMAEEAIETLLEMEDKPIELEIRDSQSGELHTVWVKPDSVALIMPLNQLAFSKTQKHLLGTFKLANKYNKKAAIKMFGDFGRKPKKGRDTEHLGGSVGQYLNDHQKDISPLEREQIIAISTEMARVIHNKLYHKGGARPNYLGWLQQELCRLTNRNYVTGCKSGKDRTGNACTANTVESAEAHYRLKAAIEEGKKDPSIPEIMNFGTDLQTSERVLNMNTALFLSPSMGITRNCVGFSGLKCDDTALGVNSPQLVYVKN